MHRYFQPLVRPPVVLLLVLIATGCGDDLEGTANRSPPPFEARVLSLDTVPLAPDRVVPLLESVLPGPARVLAVDGESRPVVATRDEVFALRGTTLERRRLFAGPGDPVVLGAIRAMSPSPSTETAWLAADAGLFSVDSQYVLPVAPIGPVSQVVEVSRGPLAGLWMAAPTALLLSLQTELAQFQIPDLSGPHTTLSFSPGGGRGVTIAGGEVLVLRPDGLDLDVTGLPFDPGPGRDAAATEDALWVAAEDGLFVLPGDGKQGWLRVDLADGPLDVTQVSADASELYAVEASGRLLAISLADGQPTGAVLREEGAGPIVADGRGGVWVATEERLEGIRLEAAPRFERDIRPFVETHCVNCHSAAGGDYRTFDVFQPRAESALTRLREGDMPRCTNNQRCPEEQQLDPSEYAILQRWIEEGMLR